jgi:signal transduction histidine kinase
MSSAPEPKKYLVGGFSAILLVLAAVIALTVISNARVNDDLRTYREATPRVAALDRMRAAASALAASANKAAALAIAKYIASSEAIGLLDREIDTQRNERVTAKREFADALADFIQIVHDRPEDTDRDVVNRISNTYFQLIVAQDAFFGTVDNEPDSRNTIDAWQKLEKTGVALLFLIAEELKAESFYLSTVDRRLDRTTKVTLKWVVGFSALGMIIALLLGFFATAAILRLFRETAGQQEALETANASLERAMIDLKGLQRSVIDAERFSTLGKLTATVSHELRNPMAAIRNSLFLIRKFGGNSEKIASNVDRAERNIKRCDNIIGDLLEYTRDRNLNLQPQPLSKWVRAVVEDQLMQEGVSLKLDLDKSRAEIMVDDDRFRRVLINLLENAGQAIRGSSSKGKIVVSTEARGGMALIDITDDGPGIPADILPKIFEPLFTTKNFGAGLGLPTAKRLVEQHQGTLTVITPQGKGTTFRVTLPLREQRENVAA